MELFVIPRWLAAAIFGICLAIPIRAALAGPTYLGIVYNAPTTRSGGLPPAPSGHLVWFVKDDPHLGGSNIGGFLVKHSVLIASAPAGNFILARRTHGTNAASLVQVYDPTKNKVIAKLNLPGFNLCTGLLYSIHLGARGHLWMFEIRPSGLSLCCFNFRTGRESGKFAVPHGLNGAGFWPVRGGALVAVLNHSGPEASITSLFFVGKNGIGHTVAIPAKMDGFPGLVAIRGDRLVGVNVHWKFVSAVVGPHGNLHHVAAKAIQRPLGLGRANYFFQIGGARAVFTALGGHHRYLITISEKDGSVLATRKVPLMDVPIAASKENFYCLTDCGLIKVYSPSLKLRRTINAVPTFFMLDGSAVNR